jgi:hypothetical protein
MPRCDSPVRVARDEKDAGGVSWIALRVVKATAMSLEEG